MTSDDRTEDTIEQGRTDQTGPLPYTGPDPARVHHPTPDHVIPGGIHQALTTQPPARRVKHPILIALALGAVIAAGTVTGLLLKGSPPALITAHGTELVCTSILGDGGTPAEIYPDVTDGTQVTVTDPDGKVIGTSELSSTRDAEAAELSILPGEHVDAYAFTVKVPGGLARYGITAGHDRGTLYYTARQMKAGPRLGLNC